MLLKFDKNVVNLFQGRFPLQDDEASGWHVVRGRQFEAVFSSRFCDKRLLSRYSEFLQNEQASERVSLA